MTANAKPVSATRLVMAQEMTPQDANPAGNVHGGNIMRLADSAAGVVAIRHSGRNCVTAAVDHFEFHAPVFIGNLVTFHASVNHVGRTSMEVGVRVEAEEPRTGKKTHTNSSYFLMVALDDQGRPVEVPKLLLETAEDRRRNEEAIERAIARRQWKKSRAGERMTGDRGKRPGSRLLLGIALFVGDPHVDLRGGASRGVRAGPAGRRLAAGPARGEGDRHGGRAAGGLLPRRTRLPRAILPHYFPENTWALTRVITISNTSPA